MRSAGSHVLPLIPAPYVLPYFYSVLPHSVLKYSIPSPLILVALSTRSIRIPKLILGTPCQRTQAVLHSCHSVSYPLPYHHSPPVCVTIFLLCPHCPPVCVTISLLCPHSPPVCVTISLLCPHSSMCCAILGPRLTNLAMELRKCCNHPYLVKGAEAEIAKHFVDDSPLEVRTCTCTGPSSCLTVSLS
jgi:hypothetical protein